MKGKENLQWSPKQIKLSELKENPANPKVISEQGRKRLQKSLEKFGLAGTVICNTDGTIIDGHSRKKELLSNGLTETDSIWVSIPNRKLTEKEYAEFNAIIDIAKAGEPDLLLMEEVFGDEFMEEWGLEGKAKVAQEDDYEIPDEIQTDIVLGDLFEIGEHRLLCGDSTDAGQVERLMNGEIPDLMITDPPYGVNYDPEWRKTSGIGSPDAKYAEGKVTNDAQSDWSAAWELSPSKVCYIWCASWFLGKVADQIERNDYVIRALIVWRKSRIVPSRGHYHWQHEPCWYAVKKGSTANWIGDRKQSTVWDIDKQQANETGHSTQKAVECMARPITNHSGDVYDPFLGSGTTMVAAHQLNRKCYGMEIDPKYCQVIVDRMRKLDNSLKILKNGDPY